MCYCLICLGTRKCGDESKECTSCLRRIDTNHFLNGDGCQCKRKQLENKKQYQNKVDKLLKIIGVVLNQNSGEEVERSARRGRYTQRVDDSEEDAEDPSSQRATSSTSADTSVAEDSLSQAATTVSSTSANTSVAGDPSSQRATSSTSAKTSVVEDPSSQYATSFTTRIGDIKYFADIKDKCKSLADFRPIAKDVVDFEVPRFQNLVKDFKSCAGLLYTLQGDYKTSYNDLRYQITQITRLNNWEFSSTLSLTEARTK
jgi:FtsZ-interacting cell division protein YlmF